MSSALHYEDWPSAAPMSEQGRRVGFPFKENLVSPNNASTRRAHLKRYIAYMIGAESDAIDTCIEEAIDQVARQVRDLRRSNVPKGWFDFEVDRNVWARFCRTLAKSPGWNKGVPEFPWAEPPNAWKTTRSTIYEDWLVKHPHAPSKPSAAQDMQPRMRAPHIDNAARNPSTASIVRVDGQSNATPPGLERAEIWKNELAHLHLPRGPFLAPFEILLPAWANYTALVGGMEGEMLNRINKDQIHRHLILSCTVLKEDQVGISRVRDAIAGTDDNGFKAWSITDPNHLKTMNYKRLILGFRTDQPSPFFGDSGDRRLLMSHWGIIEGWALELWRGYPVPLEEWFVFAHAGLMRDALRPFSTSLREDLVQAMRDITANGPEKNPGHSVRFTEERDHAVLVVRRMLTRYVEKRYAGAALEKWVKEGRGLLPTRHRIIVAFVVWYSELLPLCRNIALEWADAQLSRVS